MVDCLGSDWHDWGEGVIVSVAISLGVVVRGRISREQF